MALKLLGEINIPTGTAPSGVALKYPFGGISAASPLGSRADRFELLLLSDDRSSEGPARMYKASAGFDAAGKPLLTVDAELILKNKKGSEFPKNTVDPEGIYVAPNGQIFLSQEGSLTKKDEWYPPTLSAISKQGQFGIDFEIPNYVFPDAMPTNATEDKNNPNQKRGQRHNASLEGLSGAQNWMFTALEGGLVQDGPVTSFENKGITRIFKYDLAPYAKDPTRAQNAVGSFLYPMESVRRDPTYPAEAVADKNGISEILFWNENTGLVLERAGVLLPSKRYDMQLLLYQVDLGAATNVLTCVSKLTDCPAASPVSKKLVLDFKTIQRALDQSYSSLDNMEAMFFGPVSTAGAKTLWLVSDNNFSDTQRTQVLVFEIQ